ncbi:MAG: hypothetical protein ACJAWT_001451 [Glaciecola sp.]|jgi:hypothetical protein
MRVYNKINIIAYVTCNEVYLNNVYLCVSMQVAFAQTNKSVTPVLLLCSASRDVAGEEPSKSD